MLLSATTRRSKRFVNDAITSLFSAAREIGIEHGVTPKLLSSPCQLVADCVESAALRACLSPNDVLPADGNGLGSFLTEYSVVLINSAGGSQARCAFLIFVWNRRLYLKALLRAFVTSSRELHSSQDDQQHDLFGSEVNSGLFPTRSWFRQITCS